jgi:transposase
VVSKYRDKMPNKYGVRYKMIERETIKKVLKYYKDGLSISKIEQIIRITRKTIRKIITGKHRYSNIVTYKHDTEHLPIELNKEELERYLSIKHNK